MKERNKERVGKKDGRKEERKNETKKERMKETKKERKKERMKERMKETKKERKKERTYRDASVVPPLPSLFHLLLQYSDILRRVSSACFNEVFQTMPNVRIPQWLIQRSRAPNNAKAI